MELIPNIKLAKGDDTEVQQKKKQEYKLVGRAKRINGHTMFSYNLITGEIKKAIIEVGDTVSFDGSPVHPNKINIERDCYYEQALNKNNFIKRLKRNGLLKTK